jgi:hypothetical protein
MNDLKSRRDFLRTGLQIAGRRDLLRDPGARSPGALRPDGSVVVVVRNQRLQRQRVQVDLGDRTPELDMPPDSVGTLLAPMS